MLNQKQEIMQSLQNTYPEWEASHRDKNGYWLVRWVEECRVCGIRHRFSTSTNYSMLIPKVQDIPSPANPHIQDYEGIGTVCFSCAEVLPLTGLDATRRGFLLRSRDMGILR